MAGTIPVTSSKSTRAKRFAKIAGEMVSLSAVEALAAELWPQLITVVVALPDARKGERLVLLTTDANCTREAFSQFARRKGASELVVSKIPLLGSGKPDYVAALETTKLGMAQKAAASSGMAEQRALDTAV